MTANFVVAGVKTVAFVAFVAFVKWYGSVDDSVVLSMEYHVYVLVRAEKCRGECAGDGGRGGGGEWIIPHTRRRRETYAGVDAAS